MTTPQRFLENLLGRSPPPRWFCYLRETANTNHPTEISRVFWVTDPRTRLLNFNAGFEAPATQGAGLLRCVGRHAKKEGSLKLLHGAPSDVQVIGSFLKPKPDVETPTALNLNVHLTLLQYFQLNWFCGKPLLQNSFGNHPSTSTCKLSLWNPSLGTSVGTRLCAPGQLP